MTDLPTFGDVSDGVSDAVDTLQDHGRPLIPWLPDPPRCECGALMYATVSWDPRMVEYANAWECRACDAPDRYRDDPGVADPEPPTGGTTQLREVLK